MHFFPFVLLSFLHEIVYCDFVTPERERDRGRTFDREWVGAQYEGQASNLRARGHNARAPYPTNSTLDWRGEISLPQKKDEKSKDVLYPHKIGNRHSDAGIRKCPSKQPKTTY